MLILFMLGLSIPYFRTAILKNENYFLFLGLKPIFIFNFILISIYGLLNIINRRTLFQLDFTVKRKN